MGYQRGFQCLVQVPACFACLEEDLFRHPYLEDLYLDRQRLDVLVVDHADLLEDRLASLVVGLCSCPGRWGDLDQAYRPVGLDLLGHQDVVLEVAVFCWVVGHPASCQPSPT